MENKEFMQLLSDANGHLDALDKMVKETFKEEERMMQNLLAPIPEAPPANGYLMVIPGSPQIVAD